MAKRPSIQFYPGDWRKDPSVNCLSLAAKGLWFEMLMLMNEAPRRGYLDMPIESLARAVGGTRREVAKLLSEMESAETFSRVEGSIVNRRMLREQGVSVARSLAGAHGAAKRWQNDSKDDGKNSVVATVLPPVLLSPACAVDEAENEDEENSASKANDLADVEQVQVWLQQYVAHFGVHWSPPDVAICQKVLRALNGAELSEFEKLLQELIYQKQRPKHGYAWFVTVVEGKFRDRHGARSTSQSKA